MRKIIEEIKEKARANKKRIVFPESEDERILKACSQIVEEGIAIPYLIGDKLKIDAKAHELGLSLSGVEIRDPNHDAKFEEYAQKFYEMRKHKGIDLEKAKEIMKNNIYFGTMMVELGDADGLIGGATTSTADTVRPALQIIKTDDKFHKVSSFFFMLMEERLMVFADCAVQINPSAEELAMIAIDTARNSKKFGIDPKVAMLSFSTHGSANDPLIDKVIQATKIVKEKMPELVVDGELQVDAAIIPSISSKKCKNGDVLKGQANVFIFPDLQSGNIAYKLVERLAKANAVGPIMQGLRKPVNDLSRGCSVQDVVDVCAITAVEAQDQ